MFFDSKHIWLIIDNAKESKKQKKETDIRHLGVNYTVKLNEEQKAVTNLLQILNISINADIALAAEDNVHASYDLHDIYNFGKLNGGVLNVVSKGKWSEHLGKRW